MNAPLNIRQLAQYPRTDAAIPGTVALMQMGELGTPYASILTRDLVTSALAGGGNLNLAAGSGSINFLFDQGAGAVTLSVTQGELLVSTALRTSMLNATFVNSQSITQDGIPVATRADLAADRAASVTSFNQRTGDVQLEQSDILRAGGAPQANPHFSGWVLAPSHWDVRINDDTVVTANWVQRLIRTGTVTSFNCRTGPVTLLTSDVNAAYAVPGVSPTAPSPVLGDASNRIATTSFVDESLADFADTFLASALAAAPFLPIAGGSLTGSINIPAGSYYNYNGKHLAYAVPNVSGDNIFVGESGNTAVTGHFNVANGPSSSAALTTGSNNAGVGANAISHLTTGSNNTSVGYNNLQAETTGGSNTGYGYQALFNQSGANNNTGVGVSAGQDITTGSSNTIIGYNTGRGITTGSGNLIAGLNITGLPAALSTAMILASGGTYFSIVNGTNTFHGGSAGNYTLTGIANCCVGWLSGNKITSGQYNCALGSTALGNETTGTGNVAIGRNALGSQVGANSNTAVGSSAGSNITTGANNVFIGSSTGVGITTGTGNTIIGNIPSQPAALTNVIAITSGGVPRYDFSLTAANTHTFASGPVSAAQVITPGRTVSALPAASAALQGARCFVTDATVNTFLSPAVGGGTNLVPVVCNGTQWLIG